MSYNSQNSKSWKKELFLKKKIDFSIPQNIMTLICKIIDCHNSNIMELTKIQMRYEVDDKLKMEKRILDKYSQKDDTGNVVVPKDDNGNPIQGAVSITNMEAFSSEMNDLMEVENEIAYERINFEDLNLQTAKVKDLIKLEFLFN